MIVQIFKRHIRNDRGRLYLTFCNSLYTNTCSERCTIQNNFFISFRACKSKSFFHFICFFYPETCVLTAAPSVGSEIDKQHIIPPLAKHGSLSFQKRFVHTNTVEKN